MLLRRGNYALWGLLGLLWMQPLAYAGVIHDDTLTWQSIESTHFIIHYHDGEAKLAQKTAAIAEQVHASLTPLFDWSPQAKTEIILSDETDASNGFATPFPANRMTLYVSQPDHVNSLEDHQGWLEMLILHEYVHILHMDKASGGVLAARHIFGRLPLLFANVFMPPWMHEGLATYLETNEKMGIGRGQSSYFAMMMRVEVAAGVKPVNQINQPLISWPLLTSRYLYGVYFYQFLRDTYGEATWQKVVESYADHAMPYRINDVYVDVLGKDLSQLWAAFTLYLERRFAPDIADFKQKPATSANMLTKTGDFKRSLLQSDDGRIFFVQDNLLTGAKLMRKQDVHSPEVVLADLNAGARMDWHEQAGLLVAQPDFCHDVSKYYDLYRIDSTSGASTRLTHCQRYIYATWSPAADAIIAVSNHAGQHALHLLAADGQFIKLLWQGKDAESLSQLDWSADGETVVTSMWRAKSGWNIEEFTLKTREWRALTHNQAIETDVRYVDGTHDVVFSADTDGSYRIYSLDNKGQRLQLNHVFGGAFSPFLSAKYGLLYVDYAAQGFDVWAWGDVVGQHVSAKPDAATVSPPNYAAVETTAPQAYAPWSGLTPKYWLPLWTWGNQGSEFGIRTSGSDALRKHQYSSYVGYQNVSQTPVYQFNYLYDGWKPLLSLSSSQSQRPFMDNRGGLIALMQEQRLDASLIYPHISVDKTTTVELAASYQQSTLAWLHPRYVVGKGGVGSKDALLGVRWTSDTRQRYPRAIHAVEGSVCSATWETGAGLAGDAKGNSMLAGWQQHYNISDGRLLGMLRAKIGWQSPQARRFQLGGEQQLATLSPTNLLQRLSPLNQRNFPLRGYASNAAALQGQQFALLGGEYSFPLARLERSWMAPPLGIDQVFGQVFVDIGAVDKPKAYVGAGVELGADVVFFYNLTLRLFVGYAQGFDPDIGGKQLYMRLSSGF